MVKEEAKLKLLLDHLDGSGSDEEYQAVRKLRAVGEKLPGLLLEKYRNEKKWGSRSACVYHAVRYAKESNDAFILGLEGVRDKSKVVRYRACMLLAYSLREDALEELKNLLLNEKYNKSFDDFNAAIDAIESKNPNYFIDRKHTGKLKLRIN